MTALFILFDFVIQNPTHSETRQNLLLLEVAAGHFSRLEYASEGSLQLSLLSQFSHTAAEYVKQQTEASAGNVEENGLTIRSSGTAGVGESGMATVCPTPYG